MIYCMYINNGFGPEILTYGKSKEDCARNVDKCGYEWDGIMFGKIVEGRIIPIEIA